MIDLRPVSIFSLNGYWEQRVHNQTMSLINSFHSRLLLLFLWERIIPTLIWSQSKVSGVGFFPSSNGFCRFIFGTCRFQHQRGCVSNLEPSNLRKGDQFWIWDPGKYDCDIEMKLWMPRFAYNRSAMSPFILKNRQVFLMESKSIKVESRAYILMYYSNHSCLVKDPIRRWPDVLTLHFVDVGLQYDDSEEEFVFFLKTDEVSTSLKCPLEFSDWVLVYLFCSQVDSGCFYIAYSSKIHRLLFVYYQVFTLLEILETTSWWHWKHSLWQDQWVRRQLKLPKEHGKYLSDSSSISISRRQQDIESSPTTLDLYFLLKSNANGILEFQQQADSQLKVCEGGLNRLHMCNLLPIRLINSRVTSTLHRNCFNFLYLRISVVMDGFMYLVNTF
ncbi:unnamed protein product [Arabidopsis halleri]